MTVLAALMLPLVAGAVLTVSARWLVRTLPPAASVPALTVAALATALALGAVLTMIAFGAAAEAGWFVEAGRWSVPTLRALDPVPPALQLVAAAALSISAAGAVTAAVRDVRALWSAEVTCRRLAAHGSGLVVVDDAYPDAYALAGRHGAVVVSSALLRALDPVERRALLAHERAHLSRRHFVYVLLADLAASALLLLRPVAATVHIGVERWADEAAARSVGDRGVAARALARAALARRAAPTRPAGSLGVRDGDLAWRARALLAPAPRRRPVLTACVVALALVSASGGVLAQKDTEHRFERAQAAYTR